jgi:hypothetical protein
MYTVSKTGGVTGTIHCRNENARSFGTKKLPIRIPPPKKKKILFYRLSCMWNGRRMDKILFVFPIPLSYAKKNRHTIWIIAGFALGIAYQHKANKLQRGFLFISHRILALHFQWLTFLAGFQQVTFVDKMRNAYKNFSRENTCGREQPLRRHRCRREGTKFYLNWVCTCRLHSACSS